MSSTASYPMFTDGLVAAVDLSAGALEPPPFFNSEKLAFQKRKRQLLSFMDHRDVGTVNEHLELVDDPFLNRYAQPEHAKLMISDKDDDARCLPPNEYLGDKTTAQIAHSLGIILNRRLRNKKGSVNEIYETYTALPEPRMIYLNKRYRHRLLKVCGRESRKGIKEMLRYFSLIEDLKDCGISIRRNEWNYALAAATKFVGKTTEAEAEFALQLWKEMEVHKRATPNSVTFNILFDAASKSGNYTLADMLYKEMKARGIPFNRYHYVSLIHFFGLQEDADGVRAVYKEMVQAGETVDTVVLNCIIFGFLRCGEDKAVLRVYEYMKETRSKHVFEKPSTTEVDVQRQQQIADVTPDFRTFRILINYFGAQRGDLAQVAIFLNEMKAFNIPMHGSIFLALFQGFMRYGNVIFTEWTPARLENILSALLQALDNQVQGLYLDTWLMMWALRAFMKCTNKERTMEVYEEFGKRWNLATDKVDHMESYVARLFDDKDPTPSLKDMPQAVRQRQPV
ncbi:pentatricopeptide repeat domain-containing protein [Colletotrichum navitas]|uniref:Pentatricopeptide repeat domain-containing protein n=1 Tax=Colletotrichum navitas TaxID=681940 RepID=A0AAD8PPK8_9PEZI|nr:pentatricopeptide repeat domain-containing protein [Colletotrichum navitas]KAK1573425.1 pentatricopeptide repeat domain-containing protein [Colletotrichum navitas]